MNEERGNQSPEKQGSSLPEYNFDIFPSRALVSALQNQNHKSFAKEDYPNKKTQATKIEKNDEQNEKADQNTNKLQEKDLRLQNNENPLNNYGSHGLAWTYFSSQENEIFQKIIRECKTKKCHQYSTFNSCSKFNSCFDFHTPNERRRRPFENARILYRDIICPNIEKDNFCQQLDQCSYAHNYEEMVFHPARYKTMMCSDPNCAREFCPSAHSSEEIRFKKVKVYQYEQLDEESSPERPPPVLSMKKNKSQMNRDYQPFYGKKSNPGTPQLKSSFYSTQSQNETQNSTSANSPFTCSMSKTPTTTGNRVSSGSNEAVYNLSSSSFTLPEPRLQMEARTQAHNNAAVLEFMSNDKTQPIWLVNNNNNNEYTPHSPSFPSPHFSLSSQQQLPQQFTQFPSPLQIHPSQIHQINQINQFNHISESDAYCPNPEIQGIPASNLMPLHLDLKKFKLHPCLFQQQHNHKHCQFYHSTKDRRRDSDFYSPDLCDYYETDQCPLQDKCPKSHNRVERLYHPSKYKTKFCNFYPNQLQSCEYSEYCCFAHDESDVKVDLIHNYQQDADFYIFYFKTVWCPFTHEHNKAICPYAHNWQDFRRKPHLFEYNNELCSNWRSETFITSYFEGCANEESCTNCHGWKEQLYHPFSYKIRPCPDAKKCQKGNDCPYYHSKKEKRVPRTRNFQEHPKIIYPKNPNIIFTNNINDMKELKLDQLRRKFFHEPPQKPHRLSFETMQSTDEFIKPFSEQGDYFIEKYRIMPALSLNRSISAHVPNPQGTNQYQHQQQHNNQSPSQHDQSILKFLSKQPQPQPQPQQQQIHQLYKIANMKSANIPVLPQHQQMELRTPQKKTKLNPYSTQFVPSAERKSSCTELHSQMDENECMNPFSVAQINPESMNPPNYAHILTPIKRLPTFYSPQYIGLQHAPKLHDSHMKNLNLPNAYDLQESQNPSLYTPQQVLHQQHHDPRNNTNHISRFSLPTQHILPHSKPIIQQAPLQLYSSPQKTLETHSSFHNTPVHSNAQFSQYIPQTPPPGLNNTAPFSPNYNMNAYSQNINTSVIPNPTLIQQNSTAPSSLSLPPFPAQHSLLTSVNMQRTHQPPLPQNHQSLSANKQNLNLNTTYHSPVRNKMPENELRKSCNLKEEEAENEGEGENQYFGVFSSHNQTMNLFGFSYSMNENKFQMQPLQSQKSQPIHPSQNINSSAAFVGRKSCPVTPIKPVKTGSFGKASIFNQIHREGQIQEEEKFNLASQSSQNLPHLYQNENAPNLPIQEIRKLSLNNLNPPSTDYELNLQGRTSEDSKSTQDSEQRQFVFGINNQQTNFHSQNF